MANTSDWKKFFDQHAPKYMQEPFVQATSAEVDFLIEHLGLTTGQRILDMGCGTGRHALELARLGHHVTGVDLSDGMLAQARQAAQTESPVTLIFQQSDAASYASDTPFDRAYCVCEGSLGLIGSGEDPLQQDMAKLRSLFNALKPGGMLLITVLSAMRHIRLFQPQDIAAGKFDPASLTETNVMQTGEGDDAIEVTVREHGFVIPELRLMLETIGFDIIHIGGGTAGNWGIRPVELDEYELMAIVKKPA